MESKLLVANSQVAAFELADKKQTGLLIHILGIVLFGALAALGKKATMDLGIPGHSALLWLAVMVAGRGIINRDGAGFALGVSTALWGMPADFNNSLFHNIGLYGSTGLVLDLISRTSILEFRGPAWAITAGALAHMVKFLFIVGKSAVSVTVKRFVLLGVIESAALHLVFGVGAGLAGYGIICLYSAARRNQEKNPD